MSLEFTPDPRQESEARITALLLGEITGAEAASLLETIGADPQLAMLYERLKKTVVLVREVSANPAQPLATPGENPATPLKLSEERRQKLLAQFKTVKPKEFARVEKRPMPSWVLSVGIAAAIVLLLGSLAVPNFIHARFTAQQASIVNNLRQLDGAKQEWALENHKSADAIPTFAEIQPYMGRGVSGSLPEPVVGEKYVLGPVGKSPVAIAKGKLYSLEDGEPLTIAQTDVSKSGKAVVESMTPAPSVQLRAKFADVTQTPPKQPAQVPQSGGQTIMFQNNTSQTTPAPPQQLAQNNRQQIYLPPAGNAAPIAPAEPASNYGRQTTLAGGSVIQFQNSVRAGDGGAGNAVIVTNPPNANFYLDVNGDGLNVSNPAWTAQLTDVSKPYVSTNGFIGDYAFAAIPPGSNLNLDSIHNQAGQWKFDAGAAGSTDQNNVQLSFNTQPVPAVPAPAPVAAPPLSSSLADQLSEPQIVNESGKRVESRGEVESMRKLVSKPEVSKDTLLPPDKGGLSDDRISRAGHLPALGEVPRTGALFSNTTPSAPAPVAPVAVASVEGIDRQEQLRVAGENSKTDFESEKALERVDKAWTKTPSSHGAQQLAQRAEPGNRSTVPTPLPGSPVMEADSALPLAQPAAPPSDDLAAQNNRVLGYGNANPDKAKNFGSGNSALASVTVISTNDVSDGQQFARLYDTKKKELAELQKSRDQLARTNQPFHGAMLGPRPNPLAELDLEIREKQGQMADLEKMKVATPDINDAPLPKIVVPPPVPQPEVFTSTNAFSTFSLNIADVSFKLAAASLEKGVMPDPASIRSEEFINAFDYRDPEAPPGVPIAFAWERARYPFAQNRDLLRFSLKTAATGRAPGRPLNIVLLLDNSGSMERADRVQIIREALRVLAGQLQPQDTLSIVTFARTARLFVDGVPGNQASNVVEEVSGLTPQGGTNLEDAMRLAYETALRHYLANGINRVVLMTDGAANLGNVDPASLKQSVEAHRKQGIALDCFGIGWEGYNDDLLEVLARNGDGRYGFLNSPEEAANGFAHQLAGALNVAAEDAKVQVEFNPRRVTVYRQIGYAKLQLTKEQFRDNTVAAAQVGAAEAGNALYTVQVDPNGDGPLATVRVRYKVPGTEDFQEHEWSVPYTGNALSLEQSTPAMRLAATASAFSEWLANSPYAAEVTPDALLQDLSGVPAIYAPDTRPQKLVEMIREAKSLTGK